MLMALFKRSMFFVYLISAIKLYNILIHKLLFVIYIHFRIKLDQIMEGMIKI